VDAAAGSRGDSVIVAGTGLSDERAWAKTGIGLETVETGEETFSMASGCGCREWAPNWLPRPLGFCCESRGSGSDS
jgi:hypothetical protein